MFGMFRSKKPYIEIKIEDIQNNKPYIMDGLKLIAPLARSITESINEIISQNPNDKKFGIVATCQAPFLVGYLSKAFESDGILFRRSDAIDAMIVYRSINFKHLDERQTNNMMKMNGDFFDSSIYKLGQQYYERELNENIDVKEYFIRNCIENLSEARSIIERNS